MQFNNFQGRKIIYLDNVLSERVYNPFCYFLLLIHQPHDRLHIILKTGGSTVDIEKNDQFAINLVFKEPSYIIIILWHDKFS